MVWSECGLASFAFAGRVSVARYELIVSLLPSWRGLSVVDLGAGDGALTNQLLVAGANVTSVEPTEDGLRLARGELGGELGTVTYPLLESPSWKCCPEIYYACASRRPISATTSSALSSMGLSVTSRAGYRRLRRNSLASSISSPSAAASL